MRCTTDDPRCGLMHAVSGRAGGLRVGAMASDGIPSSKREACPDSQRRLNADADGLLLRSADCDRAVSLVGIKGIHSPRIIAIGHSGADCCTPQWSPPESGDTVSADCVRGMAARKGPVPLPGQYRRHGLAMDVPSSARRLGALNSRRPQSPQALFDLYRPKIYAAAARVAMNGDARCQQTILEIDIA